MRLINASAEYIPQEISLEGIYKQIELAGRVCYKSEDKITEKSAKDFVDMLIKKGHLSPLEHGSVYLKVPEQDFFDDFFYEDNEYSSTYPSGGYIYIGTNYRVLVENDRLDDLKYLTPKVHYLDRRATFRIICSRSIANELIRHRTASFSQESTRYCNYSKDKFGNQVTFILPNWYGSYDENYHYFKTLFGSAYEDAEKYYFDAINQGMKPQDARELLPLGLKTELLMTASVCEWSYILKQRMSKAAHPDMYYLMTMIEPVISNMCKEPTFDS